MHLHSAGGTIPTVAPRFQRHGPGTIMGSQVQDNCGTRVLYLGGTRLDVIIIIITIVCLVQDRPVSDLGRT
eukprot:1955982-Rhodomonas_salina.1